MREHPIPQDITNYRFHIIGSMTIKQFAEVVVGVMIGVFIYNTNLTTVIKWPLITLSVMIGFATAFLPFEERPLDHWLFTFLRTMYKPTQFFWRREPKIPEIFNFTPSGETVEVGEEIDFTPLKSQRIKDYIRSINPKQSQQVDHLELQRVNEILVTFSQYHDLVPQTPQEKIISRPVLGTRVRNLNATNFVKAGFAEEEVLLYEADDQALTEVVVDVQQQTPLSADQVATDLQVPVTEDVSVEPQYQETAESVDATTPQNDELLFSQTQADSATQEASQTASFNQSLPFPSAPTEPNKPVGMVLSAQNDLLPAAIVQIVDEQGMIARAIKSNALGQFYTTTPLANGTYTVVTEKDGYAFPVYSLELVGQPIPPIEIRSV